MVFFFAGLITGSFILEVYKGLAVAHPKPVVIREKVIYVEKDCKPYEKQNIPCITFGDRKGDR